MIAQVVDKFVDYVSSDDARATLESRIVQPAVRYLGERLKWCVWVFQAVAVLVLLQALMLLWILWRETARCAPGGGGA